MEICKICKKEYKNKRNLSYHIKSKHNIQWYDYLKKIKEFPKCKYCGDDVKINSSGKLSVLCNKKECLSKNRKERMTTEVKQVLREKRLTYMKNNPEKTSWRKKNISYPEKIFLNKLYKLKWNRKYNIVREEPVFPYFIDFAFIDLKIAVEIDGSQHKQKERKKSDNKKDKILKENGWRIFRIEAINLYHDIDKVFNDLELFIKDLNLDSINIEIYPEILKRKELKTKQIEEKKKKNQEEKEKLLNKRKEDYINIEKVNGWVGKLGKKWGISHTQVRRYINKYIEI